MIALTMNRLAEEIGRVCQAYPIDAKWLIAPNRRVGNQWLETVVRGGQPVLNVYVERIKSLAIRLPRSRMEEQGVAHVDEVHALVLLDREFTGLRADRLSVLSDRDHARRRCEH